MKKLLLILFLLGSFIPAASYAQDACGGCPTGYSCGVNRGTPTCLSQGAPVTAVTVPGSTGNPAAAQNCPNGQPPVAGKGCDLGYTPLEPILGVTTGADSKGIGFADLLKNLYNILITIGAMFSVVMLAISGIRYMLSDVITDKKKALARIRACLWGLLLIALSWLILHTINPQLTVFTLNPGSATITGSNIISGQTTMAQTIQANQQQIQQLGLANNSVLLYNTQDSAKLNSTIVDNMNTCQRTGGFANVVSGTKVGGNSNQSAEVCQQANALQSMTNALTY